MRTEKRFTPALLDRYRKLGRGTGIYENYIAWHRVGRSDPASIGRSHLQAWLGRQLELLSDIELVTILFSTMLKNIVDCREQFPLSLNISAHELSAYFSYRPGILFPGTLEIAKLQEVKHPKVHGGGRSADWLMTTDLLLTLKCENGELELLAIAIKLNQEEINKKRRLLAIERQYWLARDVQWLLITPSMFHALIADTLRNCVPWSLGPAVDESAIDYVAKNQSLWNGHSLTYVLKKLEDAFGSHELAQRAFWQAAWSARLPLDFRRGWRPHEPIKYVTEAQFWELNPIASRRSAWAL